MKPLQVLQAAAPRARTFGRGRARPMDLDEARATVERLEQRRLELQKRRLQQAVRRVELLL